MVNCTGCKHHFNMYFATCLSADRYHISNECSLGKSKENCDSYEPLFGLKRLKKMRNDNFETILRSRDAQKEKILSTVKIECKEYETFKKIIDAVMLILRSEDKDYE